MIINSSHGDLFDKNNNSHHLIKENADFEDLKDNKTINDKIKTLNTLLSDHKVKENRLSEIIIKQMHEFNKIIDTNKLNFSCLPLICDGKFKNIH